MGELPSIQELTVMPHSRSPIIAIEAQGRETVRELVAAGTGIGFVSAAEFGQDARLKPIPLEGASGMTMDEALVCLTLRKEGRLLRAFLAIAREVTSNTRS